MRFAKDQQLFSWNLGITGMFLQHAKKPAHFWASFAKLHSN
jgi:hypothetical protein